MSIALTGNTDGSGSILIDGLERLKIGTDGTVSTVSDTLTSTVVTSASITAASNKNQIINGNFDIWQRGTSLTTSSGANIYLADRWRVTSNVTSTVTTRQPFQTSSTLVDSSVPNNPTYYHRSVVTSVAGANNFSLLEQLIEGVKTLSSQTVTVSFWAKANATKSLGVVMYQYFGTGGTPSIPVVIAANTATLSTTWTKFTYTFSIPSVVGKVIGTNGNDCLVLRFGFDSGSTNAATVGVGQQSGTFDIAQVQLEVGTLATDFEVLELGAVQTLCERYFSTVGLDSNGAVSSAGAIISGYHVAGNELYHTVPLRNRLRRLPTVTMVNTANIFNSGQAILHTITHDDVNVYQIITATGLGYAFFGIKADAEI